MCKDVLDKEDLLNKINEKVKSNEDNLKDNYSKEFDNILVEIVQYIESY